MASSLMEIIPNGNSGGYWMMEGYEHALERFPLPLARGVISVRSCDANGNTIDEFMNGDAEPKTNDPIVNILVTPSGHVLNGRIYTQTSEDAEKVLKQVKTLARNIVTEGVQDDVYRDALLHMSVQTRGRLEALDMVLGMIADGIDNEKAHLEDARFLYEVASDAEKDEYIKHILHADDRITLFTSVTAFLHSQRDRLLKVEESIAPDLDYYGVADSVVEALAVQRQSSPKERLMPLNDYLGGTMPIEEIIEYLDDNDNT